MIQREERLVCAATFAVAYKLVHDTCRYILVYPQGCDVCNHLSLFLCVADYDKLLPGEVPASMHVDQAAADYSASATELLLDTVTDPAPTWLQVCSCCRLEPFCTVYHCCCE